MAQGQYSFADSEPATPSTSGKGQYSFAESHIPIPEQSSGTSPVGDFIRGAASKLNPVNALRGMADLVQQGYEHPLDTAAEVLGHSYMALKRAKAAYDIGNHEEAAAHLMSALDPAGQVTEASLAKTATPGKRAEGFGELVGTGLGAYLGAKAPEIAAGAGKVVSIATRNLPETAAMVTGHPILGVGRMILKKMLDASELGAEAKPPALPAEVPVEAAPAPTVPRETPPQVPPVSAEPAPQVVPQESRFDPSTVPPDPFKQTEAFQRGVEAMNARRAGTVQVRPETPISEPSTAVNASQVKIEHPPFAKNAPYSPSQVERQMTPPTELSKVHAQAVDMAKMFDKAGVKSDQLTDLPAEHWDQAAEMGGFAKPSLEVKGRVLFELRKLERTKPIMQKLQEEMLKSEAVK